MCWGSGRPRVALSCVACEVCAVLGRLAHSACLCMLFASSSPFVVEMRPSACCPHLQSVNGVDTVLGLVACLNRLTCTFPLAVVLCVPHRRWVDEGTCLPRVASSAEVVALCCGEVLELVVNG